jgi:hypothetical protein
LPRADVIPLLADLLSIPMDGQYHIFDGTPGRRKQQTLELLIEIVLLLSEEQQVLLVIEDLHWVDATTQELLSLLLDQAARVPCMLILTYRPEFSVPWPARPNQIQFMLSQFTEEQTRELVTSVAGDKVLPTEVLDLIVARTDGVPLFIEEMTKVILESDSLIEDDDGYRLLAPLDASAIPTTLQDSLMARLDRLEGAKVVAQLGAILGREFSYQLIQAVAPLEEDELRRQLSALVDAELLYQRGIFPRSRFTFKHGLVQDIAYESLLRKTRQEWHGRIAETLQATLPHLVESDPELFAHHFGEAKQPEQSAKYWLRAGMRANDQSALTEAHEAFRKGLAQVESIEDVESREQWEFLFQNPLGVTLLALKGYASPDVGPVFERAGQFAARFGGTFERFHILWGTWAWRVVREEFSLCVELGRESQELIADADDDGLRMESLFIQGLTRFYQADFEGSRNACADGFDLYDLERCRLHAQRTGQNSGVTHQCYWALSLWHLGFADQALERAHNAVSLARELEHRHNIAYALHHYGWLQQHLRNADEVLNAASETRSLAVELGFVFWIAESHLCRGFGLLLKNRLKEAEEEILQGLGIFEQSGAALSLTHFYTTLAEIRRRQGDLDKARDWVERAHQTSDRFGNQFHRAETYRVQADILNEASPDEAIACALQAVETAQVQNALAHELRATTTLAELRQRGGRKTEAITILEAVCQRVREGHATPDFRDATALLDQLKH